jgi:hypothetical protein
VLEVKVNKFCELNCTSLEFPSNFKEEGFVSTCAQLYFRDFILNMLDVVPYKAAARSGDINSVGESQIVRLCIARYRTAVGQV